MFRLNNAHALLLILVLLCLVALGSSQLPSQIGDECCREDWDPHVGNVFQAFTNDVMNFSGTAFLRELGRLRTSFDNYFVEEDPEGICKGQLNMACNPASKKCECGQVDPFWKYVRNPGNYCVGGSNTFCVVNYNSVPCKNRHFKCIRNPNWNSPYQYCKLDDNAPKGAEDWLEWGGEMFTADGGDFKVVVDTKGKSPLSQYPSFRILIFIWALHILNSFTSLCHLHL